MSCPCEAVKYASFARRSTASSVSTTATCGPVVRARFGSVGFGPSVMRSPHDTLADARIDHRKHHVRYEIQRHDGGRQKKDDRAGQLLIVRACQCLDQQRAGIRHDKYQRHDGQLVEDAVQVKAEAVDDWA